ncbi:MAG: hypothetical protein HY321_09935 [Armatimonadetes bacterium]|nr:hypothetical protein [Armatimonadota bacterium]
MTPHVGWYAAVPAAAVLVTAFVASPGAQDAPQSRPSFRETLEAGNRKYAPPPRSGSPDFGAARAEFRRALDLAATDGEKAEAVLGMGRAFLADVAASGDPASRAAIRGEYARILTLKTLTPRQRAEACLGTAEIHLAEKEYGGSREACARARAATDDPLWAARAQMLLARSCLQERDYPAAQREFERLLAMEGLEQQAKWEAEALLGAIALLPRVRAQHPRLFFNADTWPAVKERALTAEKALFDQMKAKVDAIPLEEIRPGSWASPDYGSGQVGVMDAAFVYRMTGDPVLLEKVRRMLRFTVDFFLERRPTDYSAYPRIAWSAAFDWVWNDLPAAERDSLADAMAHYTFAHICESRAAGELAGWPHYYTRSMFWFVGAALLDAGADDVAHARALSLLAVGLKLYQERFKDLIGRAGDDGVWQTNPDYDLAEVPNPIFAFLHTWQPLTGLEIPADWAPVGVSPHFALRAVVGMGPRHMKYMNYAGHSNGCWGFGQMRSDALYDFLGQYIHFFGQTHPEEAAIASYLRGRMVETGAGPSNGAFPVLRFLETGLENAPPPALPPGLPAARYFRSVGMVFMSSGFGPDDAYALFSQGGRLVGNRHDYDATHFSIYKKGHLALDTGTRFAMPHSANYRHQTVAHNAVLIRMPGERFPNSLGPVISNAGGQNRPPENATPLAFETDPLYAYTAVDAAPVYNPEKCAQMVRQFVYLPPDHFVVFDRVVSNKAEYAKTWLLHTGREPVVAGKEFRADQDQGRLFCRTLYPLDAVVETIGGPGKEFWADGRNWAITDAMQEPGAGNWWQRFGRGNTEPPEAMGRWRVEVKPGAARAGDVFLHLIQTSDQTVEKMVESRASENGDRVELTFTANARAYTIALNKAGDVGGHIRIVAGGKVLVDRALASRVQEQEGLALIR